MTVADPKPRWTLIRLVACGVICSLGQPVATSAECSRVFGVADVARNASRLDGRMICVRGMLVLTPVPQWNADLFDQLLPLTAGEAQRSTTPRLGLMDWSEETGVNGKDYKPDSFDLISAADPRVRTGSAGPMDVTLRAVVVYKKNLRSQLTPFRITPFHPNPPEIESMRSAHYDVELVLLEVVRAKRMKGER